MLTYSGTMKDGPLFALLIAALICFCCGRESEASEREPDLRERVFAVLQGMPPSVWDKDEDPNDREARLDFLAVTIATVSRDYVDAAALLTIGRFESRFARYVQAGCVDIPVGAPNCSGRHARSPWQLEEVACAEGWARPRGSDEALLRFAACARARFRGALTRCEGKHAGGRWAGAFAGYRSIDCAWEGGPHQGARPRARSFQVRLSQLQR